MHALGLDVERSLDDGARLHLGDLRVQDAEAATAEPQHGVDLREFVDLVQHSLDSDAQLLGHHLADVLHLAVGEELVERRVEEADGDGAVVHGREDALEVGALEGEQLGERELPRLHVLRHDHLPHRLEPLVARKEHVLCPHQPDPLRAVAPRLGRVLGRVRVGEHHHVPPLVHPPHERPQVPADRRRGQRLAAVDDLAGVAVERDPVARAPRLAAERHRLRLVVDRELRAPADASLAPSARHHRGVARHAAALREDALGRVHPADVLGGRLCPDEDRGAALRLEGLGLLRREDNLADGRARRGRKTLADDAVLVRALVGELGVKELVEMAGFHHVDGLVLGDEALLEHVDGDADGGGAGALAVAALEHEELLVLDRELDVLHVLVVRLEPLHVREQVLVRLGHVRLQQADGARGADASHHVLALRVDEVLAVEFVLAGGGVAAEEHASAGSLAEVAEAHGLDGDGGAEEACDAVDLAVRVRARRVPRVEHRLHGALELLLGVRGELLALLLVHLLVSHDELLQVISAEVLVLLHALLLLQVLDLSLEQRVVHTHNDIAVHVEQAPVAVVGEARAGLRRKTLDHLVVETQVEHGVHHAGHRNSRTRADRDQERSLGVTKLHLHLLLDRRDAVHDLVPQTVRELLAGGVVLRASLGGDSETRGHAEANVAHLSQVAALSSEKIAHGLIAISAELTELVDALFRASAERKH
mmetsp:Transcript_2482/g.3526  ORF Transcript_2482/g.3526 Transcript_2482/m.3526 type:complete len:709 (-) Transcript_2482:241-2367(-)